MKVSRFVLLLSIAAIFLPAKLFAQGETTSAIVGEVRDATTAAISGATVTITSRETGLKRIARTDDTGRFNFPQLKPGAYAVRVVSARGPGIGPAPYLAGVVPAHLNWSFGKLPFQPAAIC